MVGGTADHIIPARVNEVNARRYRTSSPVTWFKAYPGGSHCTLGKEGWEAVADHALDWVTRNATARRPPTTRQASS